MISPISSATNSAPITLSTVTGPDVNPSSLKSRLHVLLENLWLKHESPTHLLVHTCCQDASGFLFCRLDASDFGQWIENLATQCAQNFKADELAEVVTLLEKQVFKCFKLDTQLALIKIDVLILQQPLTHTNLVDYLSFAYLKAHVFRANCAMSPVDGDIIGVQANMWKWQAQWWCPQLDSSSDAAHSALSIPLSQKFGAYLKTTAAASDWYRFSKIVSTANNINDHFLILDLSKNGEYFNSLAAYLAEFLANHKRSNQAYQFIRNLTPACFKVGMHLKYTNIYVDFFPSESYLCAAKTKLLEILIQNRAITLQRMFIDTDPHSQGISYKQLWLKRTIKAFDDTTPPMTGMRPQVPLAIKQDLPKLVPSSVQTSATDSASLIAIRRRLDTLLHHLWEKSSSNGLLGYRLAKTSIRATGTSTWQCEFQRKDFAALAAACLTNFQEDEIYSVRFLLERDILRYIGCDSGISGVRCAEPAAYKKFSIELAALKTYAAGHIGDVSVLCNVLMWSCLRANTHLPDWSNSTLFCSMDLASLKLWQSQFGTQVPRAVTPVSKLEWENACKSLKSI